MDLSESTFERLRLERMQEKETGKTWTYADILAFTPQPRHGHAMKSTIELDASNRIVLSRELRKAAGIPRRQRLIVSATPGRIVLEMEPNHDGQVVEIGKLKVWTGEVPGIPIADAVNETRHYMR